MRFQDWARCRVAVRGALRRAAAPMVLCAGAGCSALVDHDEPRGDALLWRTPLRALGVTSELGWDGIPVTDGERVYVIGGSGVIAALDARSGAVHWRTAPLGTSTAWGAMLALGDTTLYLADDGRVAALDRRSGMLHWTYDRPDLMGACAPVLSPDGRTIYAGTWDRVVVALRASDGRLVWEARVGEGWSHKSRVNALIASDDVLYAVLERNLTENGYERTTVIAALDRATGRERWRYTADTRFSAVATRPALAGRLLVASDWYGAAFFAVDRFTGAARWRTPTLAGAVGPDPSPVVVGDTVFGGSGDRSVYALDLSSGRVLWRAATEASVLHFAVCGNRLLVNSTVVSAVDRRSRRVVGRWFDPEDPATEGIATSGFAVAGDRAIVVGDQVIAAIPCR